jgi:hypothetical protein
MPVTDFKFTFCDDYNGLKSISSSNANVTNADGDSIHDMGARKDAWGTAKNPNIGRGKTKYLNIVCTTDFASAGSPAITIDLHSADASSMSSPTTHLTIVTDKTPNAGDIIASKALGNEDFKRYMALNVAVATADLTAGKISAWIGNEPLIAP